MTAHPVAIQRRPLWWWSLWLLLGLATGLQALRMRVADAAVADQSGARAVVLRPQNAWGQALLAEEQFAAGHVDAAIASSTRSLSQSPLPVVAVRTFAHALDTKAPAGGERAWQVASTMGWRDAPTQLWALLRALSNGEADIFVMRADALMRAGPEDPKMTSVIRQSLMEPHVRAAMLHRITLDPNWRARLFKAGRPLSGRELEGTVLALRELGATAAPPGRAEVRDSIAGLIAAGRFDEAAALDRQLIRRTPDAGSVISDGGFDALEDYRTGVTPFDWTILKGATLDQSGGRNSMVLSLNGGRRPLVRRFVALSPGRYRLDYAMKGERESPASLGILVASIGARVPAGISPRTPLSGEDWERRSFDFTVAPRSGLTMIDLTAFPRGGATEAQFDDIKLVPLP